MAVKHRTGLPTMLVVAERLCQVISKFGPYLKVLYSDVPALVAAIDAASVACSTLATELEKQRTYGD
jgi:hypothetical protein